MKLDESLQANFVMNMKCTGRYHIMERKGNFYFVSYLILAILIDISSSN